MAPRRQKRKSCLSRMDAAIDAMSPYGFSANHVRRVVELLLKEYGGNEGWPFIEEFSYKELIEAILRDVGACDQTPGTEHGNPLQDKSCGDEELPAKISSGASDVQLDKGSQDNASAVACLEAATEPTFPGFLCSASMISNAEAEDAKGLEDVLPDQTIIHMKKISKPVHVKDENSKTIDSKSSGILESPSVKHSSSSIKHQRCLHCYGWIESDEEDYDDFLYLKPATSVLGAPGKNMSGVERVPGPRWADWPNGVERKRRSRWDERPDDSELYKAPQSAAPLVSKHGSHLPRTRGA